MAGEGLGRYPEETSIKEKLTRLEGLVSYDGPDKMVNWQDYLKAKELDKDNTVTFYSGFIELDSLIEGFQTGELITISGNTAQGKTLFLKSLVRQFAIQDVPVSVFSFEDPTTKFLAPFKAIPNVLPIYVPQELKTGSYEWIEARAIEAKLKVNNKVIVIDHLHYIVDMNLNKNFSLNIGACMRFLKSSIAMGLNQIVFIICHQQMMGDENEPSLNTIRDSSFIGQESDSVFIVKRSPDEMNRAVQDGVTKVRKERIPPGDWTFERGYTTLKIEKARRSGIHRKKINFIKKGDWLEAI